MAIVDNSGRGKTNLLCSLADKLRRQKKPVIFLSSYSTVIDDNGIEHLISDGLGYDTSEYQAHLRNVSGLLKEYSEVCLIMIDGLSEAERIAGVNEGKELLFMFALQS